MFKKKKKLHCYGTYRKECDKEATHVSIVLGQEMYVCEKHAKYLTIYLRKHGISSSFKEIK